MAPLATNTAPVETPNPETVTATASFTAAEVRNAIAFGVEESNRSDGE
jgi:hypothetical protein